MLRVVVMEMLGAACVFIGIPVVVMFWGVALGLN